MYRGPKIKKRTIPSNVKYVQWADRKDIPKMKRNELKKEPRTGIQWYANSPRLVRLK